MQDPEASSFEQQIAAGLMVELYHEKLYFTSLSSEPKDTPEARYIGVPLDMMYFPYFADFGPLNLGHVVEYSRLVCEALASASHEAALKYPSLSSSSSYGTASPVNGGGNRVGVNSANSVGNNKDRIVGGSGGGAERQKVGFDLRLTSTSNRANDCFPSPPASPFSLVSSSPSSSPLPHESHGSPAPTTRLPSTPKYQKVVLYSAHKTYERANAACLVGCFCVSILQYSPDFVNRLFSRMYPHFLPFRDASYGVANYNLYLLDCWSGYKKAWDLGWVSMEPWVETIGVDRHEAIRSAAARGFRRGRPTQKQLSRPQTSNPTTLNATAGRAAASGAGSLNSPSAAATSTSQSLLLTQFDVDAQFEALMHPEDPLLAIISSNCLPLYQFDTDAYRFYERLENGDWNWIVPGQIMAFSSPIDAHPHRTAISYVPMFREQRVQLVVRLNERDVYNEKAFSNQGIRHLDCNYADGSVPCDAIIERFLSNVVPLLQHTNLAGEQIFEERKRSSNGVGTPVIARISSASASSPHSFSSLSSPPVPSLVKTPLSLSSSSSKRFDTRSGRAGGGGALGGAVAVHCKAGLGRTGSLIGIYLMLRYRFTARETIGWLRICRPGCVLGEQQSFLEQFETRVVRAREQQEREMERGEQQLQQQLSYASFLGDGRGAPEVQPKGPASPLKKASGAFTSSFASSSALESSSSSKPKDNLRINMQRRLINARYGGLTSSNTNNNSVASSGVGGGGTTHGMYSGMRAALGTDKRLIGLNASSAPLPSSSTTIPLSTSLSKGTASDHEHRNNTTTNSSNGGSSSSGAPLPLSMRSATPTAAATLAMLKSIPRLGTASLQRLNGSDTHRRAVSASPNASVSSIPIADREEERRKPASPTKKGLGSGQNEEHQRRQYGGGKGDEDTLFPLIVTATNSAGNGGAIGSRNIGRNFNFDNDINSSHHRGPLSAPLAGGRGRARGSYSSSTTAGGGGAVLVSSSFGPLGSVCGDLLSSSADRSIVRGGAAAIAVTGARRAVTAVASSSSPKGAGSGNTITKATPADLPSSSHRPKYSYANT